MPGVDGRILNGSLLPARLALDSDLTSHWSVLTAIGDGAIFLNGWNDEQSAACVHKVAESIRASGIPGVIVLNLHPQNVERTAGMHRAVRELVCAGFLPWTLGDCIEWFRARDEGKISLDRLVHAEDAAGHSKFLPQIKQFLKRRIWNVSQPPDGS